MFHNILGDDGRGNPFLKQVTIAPNTWYPNRTPACRQHAIGYTKKVDTDQPIIHLCPNALSVGGIEKGYIPKDPSHHGYVQVSPVFCSLLGLDASWRMLTLAHFLISMFMLIVRLVVPPLERAPIIMTVFSSVGGAQALSAGGDTHRLPGHAGILIPNISPLRNAASFAWYSTHLFWAIHCERGFEAPTEADNIAPYTGANSILYRA